MNTTQLAQQLPQQHPTAADLHVGSASARGDPGATSSNQCKQ